MFEFLVLLKFVTASYLIALAKLGLMSVKRTKSLSVFLMQVKKCARVNWYNF